MSSPDLEIVKVVRKISSALTISNKIEDATRLLQVTNSSEGDIIAFAYAELYFKHLREDLLHYLDCIPLLNQSDTNHFASLVIRARSILNTIYKQLPVESYQDSFSPYCWIAQEILEAIVDAAE